MVRRLNEADNNINNIRNLTNSINKIKKYGEVALDRYKIIDLDEFDSIRSNMSKQSYLLNIITDLENIRNDIKSTGSSKFRRKDIVNFLKDIGFDVTEDKYSFIVESKSRTRKRSIKEGAHKPQYYDPELEQFEIFLMTNGTEGQDEIRDYVDSRRNTGIFGSVGSEYNNISVWVNTEDIDDTFVDEVEDLIIFAQEHGARINVPCYNQLKDLFTIKHAPYDI